MTSDKYHRLSWLTIAAILTTAAIAAGAWICFQSSQEPATRRAAASEPAPLVRGVAAFGKPIELVKIESAIAGGKARISQPAVLGQGTFRLMFKNPNAERLAIAFRFVVTAARTEKLAGRPFVSDFEKIKGRDLTILLDADDEGQPGPNAQQRFSSANPILCQPQSTVDVIAVFETLKEGPGQVLYVEGYFEGSYFGGAIVTPTLHVVIPLFSESLLPTAPSP